MRMSKQKEIVPKLRFPEFVNEDEWKNKRIEQLLTIGNGCDYKHLSKGDIPVYGSGGYMCSVDDFLYDGDSVCIGRKGTIDKPIFLRGKFWTVDTLFYTHSYKNCIPKFIYNIFQRINWLKYNEAGGVPSLSKTTINKINIYIPKIPEQQKIADCLSSIDELIDAESRKLKALEKYKRGLMQKLFPAEGKTLPEWRFPEFQGCREWQKSTISAVTSYVDYRGKTPVKSKDGVFLITAKNIKMGYIDYNASKEYIPKDQYSAVMSRGIPQLGDVLITTEAPCGNVAQIDKVDVALAQRVIKYRGDKNKINNTFLKYVLLSPVFQSKLKKNSTGGTVGGIKGSVLHQMSIKYPDDITEQQKIAGCLSDVDTMITEQSNKIEQLKVHKKGLMQGLFPSLEEADA